LAALATRAVSPASAQSEPPTPTSPTIDCPSPVSQDLLRPPEIVSENGVLKGTVIVTDESQRIVTSINGGASIKCVPQTVRAFRGEGLPKPPPAQPPASNHVLDSMPGPTLRARVGELVELAFVNEVNPARYNQSLDIDACMQVGKGGETYPKGADDVFPDCLHASSTANLHFHGTHTNPDSIGDNVFLQVRPLPRNNQGAFTTTPADAVKGFEQVFSQCTTQLKNPLNSWPKHWQDLEQEQPSVWLQKQRELLAAYQDKNPTQPLWNMDMADQINGTWPVFYIGAVPYCFALPAYTAGETWPPPPGSTSPIMGQSPGTHWYHAHKHGSTAINVMNGMTGAFIIEGKYDDDLNAFYASYTVTPRDANGKPLPPQPWNTRNQPVLVLNQLGTTPNLLSGDAGSGVGGPAANAQDFAVNGRVRPIAHMQPGEVQLWRILNTSARSAAYFMAPNGFKWRQLAQDGVQFVPNNYLSSEDKPFYLAPGNRVDLLVQAPMKIENFEVRIQPVMSRSKVLPPDGDPKPGLTLMSIAVSGDPVVTKYEQPMPFIPPNRAPVQPAFLADVTDGELAKYGDVKRTFNFNTTSTGRHTINGCQFDDPNDPECKLIDKVPVTLNRAEEWKIVNTSQGIDHPFHIHINPFQITEVFDPNEGLIDPNTGALLGQLQEADQRHKPVGKVLTPQECGALPKDKHCETFQVPRYVTDNSQKSSDPNIAKRQCILDPTNEATWSVAGACGPQQTESHLIWWDVFAIPTARVEGKGVDAKVIPGYFKMRTRFVDYAGTYVMHCHILTHEDRGMMFTIEVTPISATEHHH